MPCRFEMVGRLSLLLCAALIAGCASSPSAPRGTAQAPESAANSPADTNTQLAIGYMERGQFDIALEKVQRALQLDSDFAPGHTVAAVIYDEIGDTRSARRHYEKALSLEPEDGDIQNNYGVFLCKNDDYEKAYRHFERAVDSYFYETPEVALTNAGSCARQAGDLDRADRYLRDAVQRRGNYAEALFLLADVSLQRKEYLAARAFLQRYESAAEATPESLWLGVRIEQALGDVSSSGAYAGTLRQRFPESEQARNLREVTDNAREQQ